MTALEVFQHDEDNGVGTGARINLVNGQLVGTNPFAQSVLEGQRMRNPGVPDESLAQKMNGWSNGWTGIREVPNA